MGKNVFTFSSFQINELIKRNEGNLAQTGSEQSERYFLKIKYTIIIIINKIEEYKRRKEALMNGKVKMNGLDSRHLPSRSCSEISKPRIDDL